MKSKERCGLEHRGEIVHEQRDRNGNYRSELNRKALKLSKMKWDHH